jgi:uncharacterized repeat protein (TIGR01451 family)
VQLRGKVAATGALVTLSGPAVALGSWTHLVGTFDGSTLRLYVNGTLAGSAAAGTLAGGSGTSFIGRLGSGWYPFQGTLDEVAVFPTALSPERVRTHYLGGAQLRVVVTATAPTTLRTTASATASEQDPDPSTNTLTLTSTVNGARADLVLSGSAAPEPVTVGAALTYQLNLVNKGPAAASAATLTLALPAEATLGTTSTSQGSCSASGQTLSCALGALAVGAPGELMADHPAGYWRLGDPAGSTAAQDASGNALTGSYEAGVALGQSGAISGDSAAAFSGAALVIPAAPTLDLRGALSVEAWVRPSAANQNGGIFEKTVGGAANTQFSLFLEGGLVQLRGKVAATGALVTLSGPAVALGSWTHLVGTFDGSTLRLYVNGTLAGSAAAGTLAGGSGTSFIGRLGSGWYPFQGTLDEVAVFPTALSPERVRTHYLGGAQLRVVVSASQPTTLRTTASAAASEQDPDPSTNTLTLTSTVTP